MYVFFNSDEILVLDDGHVVEHGPPAELMSANGVFADLVASAHDDVLVDQMSLMAGPCSDTSSSTTLTLSDFEL